MLSSNDTQTHNLYKNPPLSLILKPAHSADKISSACESIDGVVYIVLVPYFRLRLSTVDVLQSQEKELVQNISIDEKDIIVDPLIILRCDDRVYR